MDYKEWIQQRAEELAQEKYGKDYYSLPDGLQLQLWESTYIDYIDKEAARIDAAYDAWRENQQMQDEGEVNV